MWRVELLSFYADSGCPRGREAPAIRHMASSNEDIIANAFDATSRYAKYTTWSPSQNIAGEWIGLEMPHNAAAVRSIRIASKSAAESPKSNNLFERVVPRDTHHVGVVEGREQFWPLVTGRTTYDLPSSGVISRDAIARMSPDHFHRLI